MIASRIDAVIQAMGDVLNGHIAADTDVENDDDKSTRRWALR
jgi:hypothetical protein